MRYLITVSGDEATAHYREPESVIVVPNDTILVTREDLQSLMFWASQGVTLAMIDAEIDYLTEQREVNKG